MRVERERERELTFIRSLTRKRSVWKFFSISRDDDNYLLARSGALVFYYYRMKLFVNFLLKKIKKSWFVYICVLWLRSAGDLKWKQLFCIKLVRILIFYKVFYSLRFSNISWLRWNTQRSKWLCSFYLFLISIGYFYGF